MLEITDRQKYIIKALSLNDTFNPLLFTFFVIILQKYSKLIVIYYKYYLYFYKHYIRGVYLMRTYKVTQAKSI